MFPAARKSRSHSPTGPPSRARRAARYMRANAVAFAALFFALCGTSVAASAMWTGANIVDGTLSGRDVGDDSLAGDDIDESTLTLPSSGGGEGGAGDVVARARTTEATELQAGFSPDDNESLPMSGATWTQAADESDRMQGGVTITTPGGSICNDGGDLEPLSSMRVWIYIDGERVGDEGTFIAGPDDGWPAGTHTISFPLNDATVFESGSEQEHEVGVKIMASCSSLTAPVSVDSLGVNVIGAR